ncbi:MAG TPA: YdcF family protein, partial [Anaeromyxobacteraceae bacterium]|nr:YdcF family protein [Anaeromyxobacteraceae bacterium]
MFLFLSKTLDWLVAPLSWAIVLGVLAVLMMRRPLASRALGIAAAAIVIVFSLEPVANALQRGSERGARSTYRRDVVYDAVVVLSGQVDAAASRTSGETEFGANADRVIRAFELLRGERARHVILSGGPATPQPGDVLEADRLAAKL